MPLLGIVTSMFMIVNLTFDVLLLGSVLVILGMVFYFILNMNREYQGKRAWICPPITSIVYMERIILLWE